MDIFYSKESYLNIGHIKHQTRQLYFLSHPINPDHFKYPASPYQLLPSIIS